MDYFIHGARWLESRSVLVLIPNICIYPKLSNNYGDRLFLRPFGFRLVRLRCMLSCFPEGNYIARAVEYRVVLPDSERELSGSAGSAEPRTTRSAAGRGSIL